MENSEASLRITSMHPVNSAAPFLPVYSSCKVVHMQSEWHMDEIIYGDTEWNRKSNYVGADLLEK